MATEELPPPKAGRSLKQAVITALILLALIIIGALIGKTAFFVLVSVVVLTALFELYDALLQTGHRPNMVFGLLCGFALLLVAFLERPALIAVVLALTMYGAFLLALRPGRGATAASDVAWTVLGVAWIAGGGAAATSILQLEDGIFLLVAYILITALDDIGAYFAGTRFGRHKMAPSISPAKSWEGWIGGFASSLAGGLFFAALLESLDPLHGLAVGAISGLLAPVGDLVESLAKREIGIKDSGRLLPGHGGLLDRLDAILFCAPAVYLYLRFVVT
ncbi:MAG: phosphatidate cytidylyltransferase [Actinomycetota bacterium]|nr:phosphatidate cytidylyltransferase [Actinomycetota bacterium]